LEVAAEMGSIGLLAFVSVFILFFDKAIRLAKNPDKYFSGQERGIFLGLLASILAVLIFAFSSTIIIVGVNNSVYFWIIFGMGTGMLVRATQKAKGEI